MTTTRYTYPRGISRTNWKWNRTYSRMSITMIWAFRYRAVLLPRCGFTLFHKTILSSVFCSGVVLQRVVFIGGVHVCRSLHLMSLLFQDNHIEWVFCFCPSVRLLTFNKNVFRKFTTHTEEIPSNLQAVMDFKSDFNKVKPILICYIESSILQSSHK